jgi:hypothetical protein
MVYIFSCRLETLNKDNERKKNEKSSLRRVTKIAFVVSVVFILSCRLNIDCLSIFLPIKE